MLGYSEFHHDLIYKYVALFGSLFNGVEVFRKGSTEDELVKVPLNFSSVSKVLAFAEKQHDSDQMAIATVTPRIAFELLDVLYDPSRAMNKFNNVHRINDNIRRPVPYNLMFSVNILTSTERDATRIVEQILPHFDPNIALTMFPFSGDPEVAHDIKVSLNGVSRNNDYQGMAEQRQMIVWTLQFELQGWLYGPTRSSGSVIKKIKINWEDNIAKTEISPGVDDQGAATTDPANAIDYTLVEESDDWDFIIEHKNYE